LPSRPNAVEDVTVPLTPGELRHSPRSQRIEADSHPAQSSGLQIAGVSSQENSVRGEGQIGDAFLSSEQRNQRGQIMAQEGFASGEPDLLHSQIREDPHQPLNLLERQDRLTRKPYVVVFGHAVAAPHVTAIGD
jgi:hypothetical protein